MAGKFGDFFLTDLGRKIVFVGATSLSCASIVGFILPHTCFLNKYREFVQLYNNGISVPLNKQLIDRFYKTIEILNTESKDLAEGRLIHKPFHVYGFDMFSAGSIHSKWGSIIGIPGHFAYKSVDDIQKTKIKLRGDSILWDTEEGKQFARSLILSEKAQMFAMAHEIKYRESFKPCLDVVIPGMMITLAYLCGRRLNVHYQIDKKHLNTRFTIYCFLCAFVYIYYIFLKDVAQVYAEEQIDEELSQIPELAEGGKEYYEKILQRNVALRKLLGKEGENMYTALGNENTLFRTKHVPLVQRKTYFEEIFNKQNKANA